MTRLLRFSSLLSLLLAGFLGACGQGSRASGPTSGPITVNCRENPSSSGVGDTTISTIVNCPTDSGNTTNPVAPPVTP